MRPTTANDLLKKADFLSRHLEYKVTARNGQKYSYIWFDYGCKGQDCVYTGTLSECNAYLNRILRKNMLTEEWQHYKQCDWDSFKEV